MSGLSWLTLAILATIFIGIKIALARGSSVLGYTSYSYQHSYNFLAILIGLLFFGSHIAISIPMALLAILWASAFALYEQVLIRSFKKYETNTFSPYVNLISNIVIIFVGIFIFKDSINTAQLAIALLAVSFVFLYSKRTGGVFTSAHFLKIVFISILLSVIHKSLQKVGAQFDPLAYIHYQLVFTFIAGLVIHAVEHHRIEIQQKLVFTKKLLLYSLGTAAMQVGATVCIVSALVKGPLSLVYSVQSFYIFITAAISALFFKETLTKRKIFFLTTVAILVMILKLTQ